MGDLKLVAGLGLMSGVTRLFGGLVVASIASAVDPHRAHRRPPPDA